jgi:hypothetical protein
MFLKIGLVIFLCFIEIGYAFSSGDYEEGNRDIVTVDRTVSSPFENISIRGSGTVRIYQSAETKISLTIDSNLKEYINIGVKNNTLIIEQKERTSLRPTVYIIDIYMPNIHELDIAGSGDFIFMNNINTESLRLHITGSGNIEGAVECDELKVNISGSGDIELIGKVQELELSITGSGDFECEGLEVNNAKIRTSGSGDVKIYVVDSLEGTTFGSGDIMYRGEPEIIFNSSGSGKIRSRN